MNDQEQRKVLSLLGLARKAGKIDSGQFACENALRMGKAKLVIISSDASGNTEKKFTDKCRYYHVPCFVCIKKELLGHCLGQSERSCLSVNDSSFAEAILKYIIDNGNSSDESEKGNGEYDK